MNTSTRPLKWSDFDKYLKAEHLQGRAHVLTLRAVEVEETHPRPGVTVMSPVAYFKETKKGLVLSPTNQDTLQGLFGDDVQASIGQRVTVRAISLRVAGRETSPIRISPAPAANGTAPSRHKPPETIDQAAAEGARSLSDVLDQAPRD